MNDKELFAKNNKISSSSAFEVRIALGVKALSLGIPGCPLIAGPRHALSQAVSICLISK